VEEEIFWVCMATKQGLNQLYSMSTVHGASNLFCRGTTGLNKEIVGINREKASILPNK
jgi:hypothetical protein